MGVESTKFSKFTFQRLTVDDHARVVEVLGHSFFNDEPVNNIFGYSEERWDNLCLRARAILNLNMSLAAVDQDNKTIAALLLNIPFKKDHDLGIPLSLDNAVRQFFITMDARHNLYDKFNVTQYGEIFIAAVHRDYRGQGLATEIYRRAFDLFRQNGDTIVKCTVTSPFTRKITTKLGFTELESIQFSEVRDEQGIALMPIANEDQDGVAAITVLKL